MKIRSAVLFMLICSFCFLFGCKHKIVEDPADRYRGYWECAGMEMDGKIYDDTFQDDDGHDIPVAAFYSLAFADDGTGYVQQYRWLYSEGSQPKDGFTWTEEENGVTIHGANDTALFLEYKDGQLEMFQDQDFRMWFKKVDKLTEFDPAQWQNETEEAGK